MRDKDYGSGLAIKTMQISGSNLNYSAPTLLFRVAIGIDPDSDPDPDPDPDLCAIIRMANAIALHDKAFQIKIEK